MSILPTPRKIGSLVGYGLCSLASLLSSPKLDADSLATTEALYHNNAYSESHKVILSQTQPSLDEHVHFYTIKDASLGAKLDYATADVALSAQIDKIRQNFALTYDNVSVNIGLMSKSWYAQANISFEDSAVRSVGAQINQHSQTYFAHMFVAKLPIHVQYNTQTQFSLGAEKFGFKLFANRAYQQLSRSFGKIGVKLIRTDSNMQVKFSTKDFDFSLTDDQMATSHVLAFENGKLHTGYNKDKGLYSRVTYFLTDTFSASVMQTQASTELTLARVDENTSYNFSLEKNPKDVRFNVNMNIRF